MNQLMVFVSRAAGILGALLCLVAGVSRLMGSFYVANVEATTLFMVGIGLMVFACLLKLDQLLGRK